MTILVDMKPKTQKLIHMIIGLIGMIFAVWIMIGCILAMHLDFHAYIAGCVYLICLYLLCIFFCIFWSHRTILYIALPFFQCPILIDLFHLVIGIILSFIPSFHNHLPFCIILLFASYSFCVDAYSCIFTEYYLLCRHHNRNEANPRELRVDHRVYRD
uniref:MARVEL domain-containing protein n=1 Tax=Caenorhabditis tropicalis TaxID=1561998 RepID=A0A1I7TUU1_9PELO